MVQEKVGSRGPPVAIYIYKPIDVAPDGAGSAVVLVPDRLKPRAAELVAPLPEVAGKLKPEVGALCKVAPLPEVEVKLKPEVAALCPVAPLPEVVVKLKPEVGALCPVKLKPVDPDPPTTAPTAAVVVAVFGVKLNAGVVLVAAAAAEEAVVFPVKLKVAADVEVGAAGGPGVD